MNLIKGLDRVTLIRVLIALLLLFGWEILGSTETISFFTSSPHKVLGEFLKLLIEGNLLLHFIVTAGEASAGLSLGLFVGGVIGLLLWYSTTLARALHPFILAAGSVPLVSLAPLFIVWFGIGIQMKIALSFFSTVFTTLSQSYQGACKVNAQYLDVLTAMQARPHEKFIKVIVPGSLDWVLGSMRLNIGLGLLGAFLGEFIASEAGLGHLILRASSLYNTSQAFAAGFGIAALALIFDSFGAFIERRKTAIVQLVSVPRAIWLSSTSLSLKRLAKF